MKERHAQYSNIITMLRILRSRKASVCRVRLRGYKQRHTLPLLRRLVYVAEVSPLDVSICFFFFSYYYWSCSKHHFSHVLILQLDDALLSPEGLLLSM